MECIMNGCGNNVSVLWFTNTTDCNNNIVAAGWSNTDCATPINNPIYNYYRCCCQQP